MKKFLLTIAFVFAGMAAYGQTDSTVMKQEQTKVEEGFQKIENGVVDGYKKIENGVVNGYQKIEDGAVSGWGSVRDWFIKVLFKKKGETLEEAKERLGAGPSKSKDISGKVREYSDTVNAKATSNVPKYDLNR